MTDVDPGLAGDQFLRDAGIILSCERDVWAFSKFHGKCNRPYGHSGGHVVREGGMSVGRLPGDDARTNAVLLTIIARSRVRGAANDDS